MSRAGLDVGLAVGLAGGLLAAGVASGGASGGSSGIDLCGATYSPGVIYTEVPGLSTSAAPGLGVDFTGFLSLNVSPNGDHWIFKAFVNDAENDVIVVGGLGGATIVAKENEPTPVAGSVHSFLDSDCGINDSGRWAYGSRLEGPASNVDEIVFTGGGGGGEAVAVREGDSAPGLFDPTGSGDELYGNSLNSVHVLADGTVAYKADSIENIDSDYESALYHGPIVRAQEGLGVPDTGMAPVPDSFIGLSGNTFSSSADGSSWIVEADIDPTFSSLEAALVNGESVVQDGDMLPGAVLPVDAIFGVDMDEDGDWFARGDFTDNTDWVLRNGEVIAMTGMPITPGDSETWGDVLVGTSGMVDDFIVVGNTSADRQVVVLNGERVIASSGDLIPLDGGITAEIETFSAEDVALRPFGMLAFVTLLDADNGEDLGDAFIEWGVAASCNVADIAEPCGVFDLADVSAFIQGFTGMEDYADIAEPFGVWDLADVSVFISSFVNGCP